MLSAYIDVTTTRLDIINTFPNSVEKRPERTAQGVPIAPSTINAVATRAVRDFVCMAWDLTVEEREQLETGLQMAIDALRSSIERHEGEAPADG